MYVPLNSYLQRLSVVWHRTWQRLLYVARALDRQRGNHSRDIAPCCNGRLVVHDTVRDCATAYRRRSTPCHGHALGCRLGDIEFRALCDRRPVLVAGGMDTDEGAQHGATGTTKRNRSATPVLSLYEDLVHARLAGLPCPDRGSGADGEQAYNTILETIATRNCGAGSGST